MMNGKFRFVAAVAVVTAILLLGLGGIAGHRYGSLAAASATLHGDHLVPDCPAKDFGALAPGGEATVVFRLANMAPYSVDVVGVSSSCTCTSAEAEFPLVIPPGRYRDLSMLVKAIPDKARFSQEIVVYTNDPQNPELKLNITGRVEQGGQKSLPARDE